MQDILADQNLFVPPLRFNSKKRKRVAPIEATLLLTDHSGRLLDDEAQGLNISTLGLQRHEVHAFGDVGQVQLLHVVAFDSVELVANNHITEQVNHFHRVTLSCNCVEVDRNQTVGRVRVSGQRAGCRHLFAAGAAAEVHSNSQGARLAQTTSVHCIHANRGSGAQCGVVVHSSRGTARYDRGTTGDRPYIRGSTANRADGVRTRLRLTYAGRTRDGCRSTRNRRNGQATCYTRSTGVACRYANVTSSGTEVDHDRGRTLTAGDGSTSRNRPVVTGCTGYR